MLRHKREISDCLTSSLISGWIRTPKAGASSHRLQCFCPRPVSERAAFNGKEGKPASSGKGRTVNIRTTAKADEQEIRLISLSGELSLSPRQMQLRRAWYCTRPTGTQGSGQGRPNIRGAYRKGSLRSGGGLSSTGVQSKTSSTSPFCVLCSTQMSRMRWLRTTSTRSRFTCPMGRSGRLFLPAVPQKILIDKQNEMEALVGSSDYCT